MGNSLPLLPVQVWSRVDLVAPDIYREFIAIAPKVDLVAFDIYGELIATAPSSGLVQSGLGSPWYL